MPRPLPAWLTDDSPLLDERSGLPLDQPFTSAQARSAGLTRWAHTLLLERGLLREVVRGVYAVAQLPDSLEVRAAALSLVVPEHAVVTDRTAAWLHGVDVLPRWGVRRPPPVEVFDRTGSRLRRPGVRSGVRTTITDGDVTVIDGVLVTSALRTALDLGRLLPRYEAIGALDGFVRAGVPPGRLLDQVERFKGERGVVQLRELAPLADARADSPPESALRLHWTDAGLPPPVPQHQVADENGLARYCLDLALPECRFGVEYQGRRFHSGPGLEARDAERAQWLVERDWTLLFFWSDDLYAPGADPQRRLILGLREARRRLGAWRPQGRYL